MRKRSFQFIIALIAGFLFVFGDAIFLCAQEGSSDEFTLEEITVTAAKRVENQQKVAIAMDVITGEKLAEAGKTNVDDILSSISNVMVNMAADGMRVSVRGLVENETPSFDMHSSSPMVAINVDGAYNSASSAGQNLFDIERVEVLYGPQSTLYASNSPGGIMNVVTAAPKTDRYSVNLSAEYGSYNLYNIQFAGNAPIVKDMLAMRLAGQIYRKDTFLTGETGQDTKSARLKTLFQPNDKFSATVTINYTKRINGGMMMGNVKPFDYQDGHWLTGNSSTGQWTKDGKVTNPWTSVSTEGGVGGGGGGPGAPRMGPNQGAQITEGVTGEIDWDLGIGNLSIVPQYSKTSSDDSGSYTGDDNNTYAVYTKMRGTQRGIEARMTSAEDFFIKWIMGANYYKNNNTRNSWTNEPGALSGEIKLWQKDRAVFGNITYPITDKFRGNAGYRMSWDKGGTLMNPPPPGVGASTGQEYSNPDYKLGVEYDLAENSMFYASYATSYRVNPMGMGQANAQTAEKLKSYTVGAKNRFFGNKLQFNASAYYYDYTNKAATMSTDGRVSQGAGIYEDDLRGPNGETVDANGDGDYNDPTDSAGGAFDPWNQQVGAFRTLGADISAEWVITNKDRLTLGISYLNAEWKDLKYQYYWKNVDGSNFWASDGKDYSGYTNTYSPAWTITSSYEHSIELGTLGFLLPHVDLQYKSEYFLDYVNQIVTYQEPYYVLNGSLTFNHANGIWSLNAYVKNAANYAAKNFFIAMGSNNLGISDPRTYGAVLSVKF
jgi:iron complex outermembrane receptor protein